MCGALHAGVPTLHVTTPVVFIATLPRRCRRVPQTQAGTNAAPSTSYSDWEVVPRRGVKGMVVWEEVPEGFAWWGELCHGRSCWQGWNGPSQAGTGHSGKTDPDGFLRESGGSCAVDQVCF